MIGYQHLKLWISAILIEKDSEAVKFNKKLINTSNLMFETNFILINHKPSNKFFKNRIFFPLLACNFVINFINATNIYISRLIFIDESFC